MKPNPTAVQDKINFNLPVEDQFPAATPGARCIDTDPLNHDDFYPDSTFRLVRCSIENHPLLAEAQAFFAKLRDSMHWLDERPIFRTATYWCKHILVKESP